MFSEEFLAQYTRMADPFTSLLSRAVYVTHYRRPTDGDWTGTVVRVVTSNVALDPNVTQEEAEKLFDCIWHMRGLPPGRGLWAGGAPGVPGEALLNCHACEVRSIDDLCWSMRAMALGGGVGYSLLAIDQLPSVRGYAAGKTGGKGGSLAIRIRADHPDAAEVQDDGRTFGDVHVVGDSREGWVEALRVTLEHAWAGNSLTVVFDNVRERGALLKTFGGTASGPFALANLLRTVWAIVRGAVGRKLTSVEVLDIINHLGCAVVSGAKRRSAIVQIGSPHDDAFRLAKHDTAALASHRYSSNNSIAFLTQQDLDSADWERLAQDVQLWGEPGTANLFLARKTDPDVVSANPCMEQYLEQHEACCLADVMSTRCATDGELKSAVRLLTRYALRQRLIPMSDPAAEAARVKNMRIGVSLSGIVDARLDARPDFLRDLYSVARVAADEYADALGVARPRTCTTIKPSGTLALLAGCSPGIHARYAPYVIRNVRFDRADPILPALRSAGVPLEDAVGNPRLVVASFVDQGPDGCESNETQTLRGQLERQLLLQNTYVDNAISATTTFRESERGELADAMRDFVPLLKSTSYLPFDGHAYVQAPFIPITREEYALRAAAIDENADLSVVGGDTAPDFSECQNGVCPVRLPHSDPRPRTGCVSAPTQRHGRVHQPPGAGGGCGPCSALQSTQGRKQRLCRIHVTAFHRGLDFLRYS